MANFSHKSEYTPRVRNDSCGFFHGDDNVPTEEAERKYYDLACVIASIYKINLAVSAAPWTGAEADPPVNNCLFSPAVGLLRNERVGRQVLLTRFDFRALIQSVGVFQTSSYPMSSPIVRLVLYLDRANVGSQPPGANVIFSGATPNLYHIIDPPNSSRLTRFQILKDETITVPTHTQYSETDPTVFVTPLPVAVNWFLEFPEPLLFTFNNLPGQTVGSLVGRSLHLLCASHASVWNVGLTDFVNCTLAYRSRATFIEFEENTSQNFQESFQDSSECSESECSESECNYSSDFSEYSFSSCDDEF